MSTKEKSNKPKPIKKVPLIMGLLFTILGIVFIILIFISPEETKATYAVLAVALLGFGVTYLDKSKVLDR